MSTNLEEQFGLDLCEDCGEPNETGCTDECQCDGCREARAEAWNDARMDTYD